MSDASRSHEIPKNAYTQRSHFLFEKLFCNVTSNTVRIIFQTPLIPPLVSSGATISLLEKHSWTLLKAFFFSSAILARWCSPICFWEQHPQLSPLVRDLLEHLFASESRERSATKRLRRSRAYFLHNNGRPHLASESWLENFDNFAGKPFTTQYFLRESCMVSTTPIGFSKAILFRLKHFPKHDDVKMVIPELFSLQFAEFWARRATNLLIRWAMLP